jgi:chromosome partitioning protein
LAIILTIANQKGGVGKTTTSVNLAAALSQIGKRVLLVDLDPQGNATMGSGIDKRRLTRSVYHVMIGMSGVAEASQQCETGGYSLLPANRELAGAEIELVEFDARETRLKAALGAVATQYDFILIDSPPSLSLLTLNALCAADGVVIPMQCEYYALEGLTDLVNTIRKVHANFNPAIRIIGILRVMFDSRITLSQQVSAQLEEHFKDKVFRSIIPRNIRLAEAPSHGLPGVIFDPSSRGALGYVDFATELVERMPQLRAASGPVGDSAGQDARKLTEARETAKEEKPDATSTPSPSRATSYDNSGMQAPTYLPSRMGAGHTSTTRDPATGADSNSPIHPPADRDPAAAQSVALPTSSHGEPLR